jgi:hypothetical protein
MKLWCCQCQTDVEARLTNGAEVYPHRPDLADVPRWICDGCKNHVGTHHKTDNPTRPLGNIPSPELKKARIAIHNLIDPHWKSGAVQRKTLYAHLSKKLGREYHTGELRTIEEARAIYAAARDYLREKFLEGTP